MLKTNKSSTLLYAAIFILPFFVLYTVFIIWPVAFGFFVSLHRWSLMGKQAFLGLENYKNFLGDSRFWAALGHTGIFTAIGTPLLVLAALVLAILANRPTRLKHSLRIVYYLPNVLSVSVISSVGRYFYSPYTGVVNGFLHATGILKPSQEILWFEYPQLAWFVIISITVWWTVGFSMLLYISALQDISPDIYDAAEIDGASKRQQLFRITLPLLKSTTWLIFMLQMIACFKVFGQIYMMTEGGPASSTRPLVQYIYETAFERSRLGRAAAMGNVLFAIIFVMTLIQQRLQRRKED